MGRLFHDAVGSACASRLCDEGRVAVLGAPRAGGRGLVTAAIDWPETAGGPIDYAFDSLDDDQRAAILGAAVFRRFAPALTAIHFARTDEVQHASGPATPQAFAALEETDARIAYVLA